MVKKFLTCTEGHVFTFWGFQRNHYWTISSSTGLFALLPLVSHMSLWPLFPFSQELLFSGQSSSSPPQARCHLGWMAGPASWEAVWEVPGPAQPEGCCVGLTAFVLSHRNDLSFFQTRLGGWTRWTLMEFKAHHDRWAFSLWTYVLTLLSFWEFM